MQTFWFPWCLSPGSDTSSRKSRAWRQESGASELLEQLSSAEQAALSIQGRVEGLQPLCWGTLGRCWQRCVISCQALLSKTATAKGLSAPTGSHCWHKPGGSWSEKLLEPTAPPSTRSGQELPPLGCLHLTLTPSYVLLTITSHIPLTLTSSYLPSTLISYLHLTLTSSYLPLTLTSFYLHLTLTSLHFHSTLTSSDLPLTLTSLNLPLALHLFNPNFFLPSFNPNLLPSQKEQHSANVIIP